MLNEILEVSEYLYDVKNTVPRPERIKRTVFLWQNDLLGMERLLTMVARYFIFEDGADYEEGIKRANAAIHMWCGHAPQDISEDELADQYEYLQENYPWIDHWLPEYLRAIVSDADEKARDQVEKGIETISNKKKGFSVSSFHKNPGANDFKAIRYDKVIANAAVARGPLKKYYLACEDPDWELNVHGENGKKLNSGLQDRVLKTIAAYMLERSLRDRHDEAPRYEPINYMDITFWAVRNSRLSRDSYKGIRFRDDPLFSFQAGMSGNSAKIRPNTEWFERCGWHLIEATDDDAELDDFLDNYPEAIFYSDKGGGLPLSLNERYERY